MAHWQLSSPVDTERNNIRDAVVDLQVNEANGQISGTVTFMGDAFTVTGNSAAAGSVPGRKISAFSVSGACEAGVATSYLAATGTLRGTFVVPTRMDINIVRAASADGEQYGWDGSLTP